MTMSLESEIINAFALDVFNFFYPILECLNEEWTFQLLFLAQHCIDNALADFVWYALCPVGSSSTS